MVEINECQTQTDSNKEVGMGRTGSEKREEET